MAKRALLLPGLIGLVVISIGLGGHVWNERRADRQTTAIKEAKSTYQVTSSRMLEDAHEGSLVFVSGPITIEEQPTDPLFAVTGPFLRLDRVVEMYQWRETKRNSDDQNYVYKQAWIEGRIRSENFRKKAGHQNPPAPPFANDQTLAVAKLGVLTINNVLLSQLPLNNQEAIQGFKNQAIEGIGLKNHNSVLYSGDPNKPGLGDVRVRFETASAEEISILAKRDADLLVPWQAANGEHIALITPSSMGPDQLLGSLAKDNWLHSWGYRVLFTMLAIFGSIMALPPLAQYCPPLQKLRSKGVLFAHIVLPCSLSLTVIALARLIYSPIAAIACLVVAAGLFALMMMIQRKRSATS